MHLEQLRLEGAGDGGLERRNSAKQDDDDEDDYDGDDDDDDSRGPLTFEF